MVAKTRAGWLLSAVLLAACSGSNEPNPDEGSGDDVDLDAGGDAFGDDVIAPDVVEDTPLPDVVEDTPLPDVVEDTPEPDVPEPTPLPNVTRLGVAGGEGSGEGVRLRFSLSWAPATGAAEGSGVRLMDPGSAAASATGSGPTEE